MKTQIANIITGCRILCSILMLFFRVFSPCFSVLYLFCGFTDMVDGTVARKTNAVSAFGARLDTAADIAFTAAALIKFLPAVHIPGWLWIWIAGIVIIKTGNLALGFLCRKRFVSLHTVMNKVTGLLLFLLPLTLPFPAFLWCAAVVCAIAAFAAIQEGYYIAKDNFKPISDQLDF